jgi:PAS domain S-box-containing protein
VEPEQKVNILLVDDSPAKLLALEATLADLGQNLVKARSGEEALKQLLRQDFAVILLDVSMPGMDGFETAQMIRRRKRSEYTPIIFVSAICQNETDAFKGYALGAVDYLFTPIPEVMRAKVAVFVELFKKTEEVKRHSELLRQIEERKYVSRLTDATERLEAETRRNRFFTLSIDMLAIAGFDGYFKQLNPTWEKTLGFATEELKAKPFVEFIHPGDQSATIEEIGKLTAGELSTYFENRSLCKDGSYKWLGWTAASFAAEGLVYVFARDITERKRAEETIQSLLRIGKRLNSTLNLNILMDALVEESIQLVCAEGGFSGLRTPEGLASQKYFQNSTILPFKQCWPPGQGLPGWLISHKVPYRTNDARRDRQITHEVFENLGIRSVISTPILDNQEDVLGFFEVHNKKGTSGFTQSDQDTLTAVAQTASIAIQNALAYQRIRRTEEQLRSSREQLLALSGYLISVREEERTRIAREIHDELGQALTGLKMDLARVESRLSGTGNEVQLPLLLERLRSMATLVDTTIQSVRRIATDLRPGILDNFGLVAAIEWQAQEFQNRTGIRCTFTSTLENINLDQDRCTAVFRILQEALTNVARHAGATRATISLHKAAAHLILEVTDNGKGITESDLSKPKSFGLLGMRERAALLGGELHTNGVQGKGTTLTVWIPFEQSGGQMS